VKGSNEPIPEFICSIPDFGGILSKITRFMRKNGPSIAQVLFGCGTCAPRQRDASTPQSRVHGCNTFFAARCAPVPCAQTDQLPSVWPVAPAPGHGCGFRTPSLQHDSISTVRHVEIRLHAVLADVLAGFACG
jgi:hypothetical protein